MKMRHIFALILLQSLMGCGNGGTLEAYGRKPALVGNEGISYPRDFDSELRLDDSLTGAGYGRLNFAPKDLESEFGCSEDVQAKQFVFFMRQGEQALKVTVDGQEVRESKTVYPDLARVELAGKALGLSFDPNKQAFQLTQCQAHMQRQADRLTGTLTCDNVTSQFKTQQYKLLLKFTCSIMKR